MLYSYPLILSHLAYPLFLQLNNVPLKQPLDSVHSEQVVRVALALWRSYNFGSYMETCLDLPDRKH
jgi:hypothetical protein